MSTAAEAPEEFVIVHWPGQETIACPRHLNKLRGLARVMGFELSWTPTAEGPCGNCENEKKKP